MGTPGNPICFHAGRMPLPSLVVGLGVWLLGNHYLHVAILKTILLLLPIEAAIYLVWLQMPLSRVRATFVTLLLLVPFAITAFLADVVNLQVEEGYVYSFLALAVALILFGGKLAKAQNGLQRAILFAIAVDGVYLAKSSMAPAALVLLAGFLLLERRRLPRLVAFLLIAAAPMGWAIHQHHASRRYSIGTSIDGMNLHKANNPEFLNRYPPPPGDSLDRFDPELNQGLHFNDEWSFNDYHQREAVHYLLAHPGETVRGDIRKVEVFFFSIEKYGSSANQGILKFAETAGLVTFRLMLWAAIACAAYTLFVPSQRERRQLRLMSAIFLTLVAACAFPYLVGFAYTRHASILIYPSALMCCRMLTEGDSQI
jgi:hypothetical protein